MQVPEPTIIERDDLDAGRHRSSEHGCRVCRLGGWSAGFYIVCKSSGTWKMCRNL